jgi:hypothetical protein
MFANRALWLLVERVVRLGDRAAPEDSENLLPEGAD